MASLLIVAIFMFLTAKEIVALAILGFMVFMLTVWAIFDFCPAVKMLSKFLKPCGKE
jgi:hypothetical protein